MLAFFQKKLNASETGKFRKQTKVVKIQKVLSLGQFFKMMEQKINPCNLGFWTLDINYFKFILAFFKKNWMQVKLEKFERRLSSRKNKKFYF